MTKSSFASGALTERYFKEDPATSLIKMRQCSETLAHLIAAKALVIEDRVLPYPSSFR